MTIREKVVTDARGVCAENKRVGVEVEGVSADGS